VQQDRVDALHPGGVLLAQVLEQLQPGAHLQHLLGRDPRLGQSTAGEQIPQQPGVGAVGLRPPLRAAGGRGIGRLGQVRLHSGTLQLLHHEPPAGAGLDRERRRRPIDVRLEPATEQHPVRGGDPTPPYLAAALIAVVEGDLPPVNVQSAYDPHRGPPQAPQQPTHSTVRLS
jgi:hypothetical protein